MSASSDVNPRLSLICEKFSICDELVILQEAIKDFKTSIAEYSAITTQLKYGLDRARNEEHSSYFIQKMRKYEAAVYHDLAKLIIAINMAQKILTSV